MNARKLSKSEETLDRLRNNPDIAEGHISQAVRIISERCLDVMDVDRISIWKLSREDDIFRSIDSYDLSLRIHSSGEIISCSKYPVFMSALQKDRLICSHDVHTDPRTSELIDEIWKPLRISSALIAPIHLRGRLEGMIRYEQSKINHEWTPEDEIFAREVAGLVAELFLLRELNDTKEQLRAHENTIGDLARLTNFQTILKEALDQTLELTGANLASLFRVVSERREIECLVCAGAQENFSGVVMKYGQGVAGCVAETGRSLRIADYYAWSGRNGQTRGRPPYTAVMAVPVRYQGRTVGVIEVGHDDSSSHFSDSHRKNLERYAHDIAVVLVQKDFKEQIESLKSQKEAIHRLVALSTRRGKLNHYLEATLHMAMHKLGLTRGIIRFENSVVMEEIKADEEQQFQERLFSDLKGFASEVIVNDWRDYTGVYDSLTGMIGTMNIRASMFVPLLEENETAGYLGLFSASPREWNGTDVELVRLIAAQAVIKAEKIRDSEEKEKFFHRLSRLNAFSREVNRQLPFDEAVSLVGQGAVELMDADHASLFLKNPDESLSVAWHYSVADTNLQKGVHVESQELSQLLLGGNRPVEYQNHKNHTLPDILRKYMTGSSISAAISLPLVYSNETVGNVLTFFNLPRTISKLENDLLEAFSHQAAAAMQNAWLFERIDHGYTELALSLAESIEKRESKINNQNQLMARLAVEVGRKMSLDRDEIHDLHWAAMLHDIGKSAISDEILEKAEPLSEEERKAIQRLPDVGADMIEPLTRFEAVSSIVRNCRERVDGSGYPNGLKGDQIPLSARILSVADAYCSITSDRPYHRAKDQQEAFKEINTQSGRQFDPAVVKVFIETVESNSTTHTKKTAARHVMKTEK